MATRGMGCGGAGGFGPAVSGLRTSIRVGTRMGPGEVGSRWRREGKGGAKMGGVGIKLGL